MFSRGGSKKGRKGSGLPGAVVCPLLWPHQMKSLCILQILVMEKNFTFSTSKYTEIRRFQIKNQKFSGDGQCHSTCSFANASLYPARGCATHLVVSPAGPASWQSQSRPWCLASTSVNFEYQETPQVSVFTVGYGYNAECIQ